jgi:hypothetical protein
MVQKNDRQGRKLPTVDGNPSCKCTTLVLRTNSELFMHFATEEFHPKNISRLASAAHGILAAVTV